MMLADARAVPVAAPRVWAWKNVTPMTPDTDLSDEHYRIAARMSLGLPPMNGMAALPDDCPLCDKQGALRTDAWHFLTCKMVQKREVDARHDEVVNTLYRCALMMGIQAVKEPAGLHSSDGRCPDLQLVLPRPPHHYRRVRHAPTCARQSEEQSVVDEHRSCSE